jgi:hypothetical protein
MFSDGIECSIIVKMQNKENPREETPRGETPGEETPRIDTVSHQIEFLKQVIVVMLGLALTNSLQNYIDPQWPTSISRPSRMEETFVFGLLVLNLVRFFYSNWMSLEKTFEQSSFGGKVYLVNFLIIISQSIAFTVLSFYKQLYPHFFLIFVSVLFIDVLGFGILATTDSRNSLRLQLKWLVNNFLAAVMLAFIINPIIVSRDISFWLAIIIAIINTIVGFLINWKYYSPTDRSSKAKITS